MSDSPLLSADDLVKVTKKKQPAAQKKALVSMKIPFIERADGSVLLTWPAIHYQLIGKEENNGPSLSGIEHLG